MNDISEKKLVSLSSLYGKDKEFVVGVRVNTVYSQIAKMGRVSNGRRKKAILVDILDSSRTIIVDYYGRKRVIEPDFVKISIGDAMKCFDQKNEEVFVTIV